MYKRQDKGGFKHSQSDTTSSNGLATEQAYYALASWYRLKAGKTSLYDMSDVTTMSKIIEKTVVNGGDSAKDPKKDTLAVLEAALIIIEGRQRIQGRCV